ncbi:hypothetical protein THASP1DRAFT_31075 [Thamnocephalis sphaerospora]|uniref:Essential protein Yae1 N-terminal domain-containing protein n=1 Tax=Thamnocephalis sphaerospora TaxID=78915 RepID=A0A4P9XMH8_9FUNG|nr:hypothetical protein THASP1DRAFT_31075 [Thamnocephalis sphaerospora]|eukprot:RKP07114.1 hypothetical protein THASP1DRAFT_31075 [Thamnocephalis sphaerospora]
MSTAPASDTVTPVASLDDLLHLEERFQAVGRTQGERDGERLGVEEGRALGRQRGLDIGLELGYYAAFATCWSTLIARRPENFTARATKTLAALSAALDAFPEDNQLSVDALALLGRARAKFKAAATVLGVARTLAYMPAASDAAPSLNY